MLRDRASVVVVVGLCLVKALVHLVLVNRYGYHGDELYFIECGRHAALGYVDHPPLIPWMAALADALGGGLLLLRLPAIAAGVGTMLFTALLVREWGGGFRAQLLALLCLLGAPAHLRLAAMLNIPVVEVFLCTAAAYLVVRALARGERWTWVLAGGVVGLAILAKHTSLLWAGALIVGIVATPVRRQLANRWPWIGAVVAVLTASPNVLWQIDNEFVTYEFMRTMREEILVTQGRALFVAGQLLYFHPLAVPVWIAGLIYSFTPAGPSARPSSWLWLLMFGFLLVAGGKPYYLASAYPAVLAAGGVALERWLASRRVAMRSLVALLATTGLALGVVALPVLPIRTIDAALEALLGWAVPSMALTHDLHGMYGWREHAGTIDAVYRSLPPEEREQASVLVGSYSQAAALNVLRVDATPRAVSGNMSYFLWGPDAERGAVLISYGVALGILERHYRSCIETAHIDAPLARPWDTDLLVVVCREPLGPMRQWWPDVRRFGHGIATSSPIVAD